MNIKQAVEGTKEAFDKLKELGFYNEIGEISVEDNTYRLNGVVNGENSYHLVFNLTLVNMASSRVFPDQLVGSLLSYFEREGILPNG